MKTTKTYLMNGNTYTSMTQIAKELGVNRVRPTVFAKYGITEILEDSDVSVTTDTVEVRKVEVTEYESQILECFVNSDFYDKGLDSIIWFEYFIKDVVECGLTENQVKNLIDSLHKKDLLIVVESTDKIKDTDTGNGTLKLTVLGKLVVKKLGFDDSKIDTDFDITVDTVTGEEPSQKDSEDVNKKVVEKKDKKKSNKTAAPKKAALAPAKKEGKKEDKNEVVVSSLEDYSRTLKKASLDDLIVLAETAGVDLYKTLENMSIRRMRITMALKSHYYPNEKLEVKKATVFKKIELGQLIALADSHKLDYTKVSNEPIQRMWVTKALIDAGLTEADLPNAKTDKKGND